MIKIVDSPKAFLTPIKSKSCSSYIGIRLKVVRSMVSLTIMIVTPGFKARTLRLNGLANVHMTYLKSASNQSLHAVLICQFIQGHTLEQFSLINNLKGHNKQEYICK